jgi:hypothetical protein
MIKIDIINLRYVMIKVTIDSQLPSTVGLGFIHGRECESFRTMRTGFSSVIKKLHTDEQRSQHDE